MGPIASITHTITCSDSEPTEFILPDFFSISYASDQWACSEANLPESKALKYSTLLHLTYFASSSRASRLWLKLDKFEVNDALEIHDCCISAFHDPVNFQTENHIAKLFFSRFKETAGPGCTEHFIQRMELWYTFAAKEMDSRTKGYVYDIESYIKLRHDLSGCKPCFAFIEFTCQIDLPDEVISHLVVMALGEATNDFDAWSNDISSYDMEQSNHSTCNLVYILMDKQGLNLQGTIDYCSQLCNICVQHFEKTHAILPLWGEEVDKDVAIYIQGLQDWIAGLVQKDGHIVKWNRIFKLSPK
ncbi:terpenoid synthase [Suillus hirtellus]|nr:terpenoid synthase [Suillus hirtellus]